MNLIFLILYCALIFWLSNQATIPIPASIPHIDKLIHLTAYFIMGILAWRAVVTKTSKPLILTILFCSLYGLSDEWHQSYVVGRYADLFDWLADTCGGILAALFMRYWQRQKHRRFGFL